MFTMFLYLPLSSYLPFSSSLPPFPVSPSLTISTSLSPSPHSFYPFSPSPPLSPSPLSLPSLSPSHHPIASIHPAYVNYFSNILDENKHDIKNTWSILRSIIGKQNDKSSYPSTFTINNTPTSNKYVASESFNSYFSHIGLSTSQNVPTSKNLTWTTWPTPPPRVCT